MAKRSTEYNSWRKARERCYNKNCNRYKYYGARGIKMNERWSSFKLFLKDMGKKPDPSYHLDRIDNDKDYSPENCQWLSPKNNVRKREIIKLNVEKVKEIKSLLKLGVYHQTTIANKFNVHRTTISAIKHNKIWADVAC